MFKKIEINIPFAEELVKMPNYENFMKEIQSKKKRFAKKRSGEFDIHMQCCDPEEPISEEARS